MKKAVVVIVFVLVAGALFSSCARHACPAYSQTDTEQTDNSES